MERMKVYGWMEEANKAAAAATVEEEEGEDFEITEEEEEEEEAAVRLSFDENSKKKSGGGGGFSGKSRAGGSGRLASAAACQAEGCATDMSRAKEYHQRHKVCQFHAKAAFAMVAGSRQRFCQQCSRFHELSEFDEAKRSCRRRLAGHNERRRKSLSSSPQFV